MGSLEGKRALVTGASRGIGRAVAQALAREGARVTITSRSKEDLDEVLAGLSGEGHAAFAADMAKPDQIDHLAAKVRMWCDGRLDVLVNNAGILGPQAHIGEVTGEEFAEAIRINLLAPFQLTADLISLMPEGACIINVASSVSLKGRGGWAAYAASKAALHNLTESWAQELEARGICVVSINPGATHTAMRAEAYPDENSDSIPAPEAIAPVFVRIAKGEFNSGAFVEARDEMR